MIVAPNRTPHQDHELECAIRKLLDNSPVRRTPAQRNTFGMRDEWRVKDFLPTGDEERAGLAERLDDLRAHRSTKAGAKHIVRAFGQLDLSFYLQSSESSFGLVNLFCRQCLMSGLIPAGEIPEHLTVGFAAALIDAAWEAFEYGRHSPAPKKPQRDRLVKATDLFLSPFSTLNKRCYVGHPFGTIVQRMITRSDNRSDTPIEALNCSGLELEGSNADIETFYRFATMAAADAYPAMIGLLLEHGGSIAPVTEAYREVRQFKTSPAKRRDDLVLTESARIDPEMELFPGLDPDYRRQRLALIEPLSALQACGALSEPARVGCCTTVLHKRLFDRQPAA